MANGPESLVMFKINLVNYTILIILITIYSLAIAIWINILRQNENIQCGCGVKERQEEMRNFYDMVVSKLFPMTDDRKSLILQIINLELEDLNAKSSEEQAKIERAERGAFQESNGFSAEEDKRCKKGKCI
ncbi:hypothetical protein ACFPRA_00915 [Sporosarcina soli]|uniref:Uncharacterized protein n=1 Tax=Sporosarcina soli TaxID=334736 RepID=A0ABW0TFF0_9BACL